MRRGEMQPQDVYNRAYDTATRALDQWIHTIKDVAVIDREQTARDRKSVV